MERKYLTNFMMMMTDLVTHPTH